MAVIMLTLRAMGHSQPCFLDYPSCLPAIRLVNDHVFVCKIRIPDLFSRGVWEVPLEGFGAYASGTTYFMLIILKLFYVDFRTSCVTFYRTM